MSEKQLRNMFILRVLVPLKMKMVCILQVYRAEMAAGPTSLAPATGDHFIPSVASLAAKQHKQAPVALDTGSQMKREAPSPNTVAGLFSNLGVSMRTPNPNVDLSTIVETRSVLASSFCAFKVGY